jgi:phosphoribosylformylglycinamidine synthase
MGKDIGAEVELSRAPLTYEGLTYTEIWISEAQERMVVAVPPEKEAEFHDLMRSEDVESTTLGHFTDTGELRLLYRGQLVGQINMKFLHDGIPRLQRKAEWNPPSVVEPELPIKRDYGEDLKRILGAWNVCSKEWVIRQYDHEVQGASVLKPLVGAENDGPGDATVIAPVLGSCRGVAVANGMNPKYGDVDPYAMAASAIEEAIRQIIAVGGTLDRIALLDNFCWGNTDKPDRLGSLVLAAQACHDLSLGFGTPFISGKDSLNNEFQAGNETIVIPPSLLISAIGLLADIRKVVSMDAKAPGNRVYLAGLTKRELGGSHYYALNGYVGRQAPQVDIPRAKALMTAVSRAMDRGLVRACHDCSEGGLAVAAAEMAFAGGFGIRLQLGSVPADPSLRPDELLFSESNSRFLMEVEPQRAAEFEAGFQNLSCARIGEVTPEPLFSVFDAGEKEIIHERLADLKEAWQRPLRW